MVDLPRAVLPVLVAAERAEGLVAHLAGKVVGFGAAFVGAHRIDGPDKAVDGAVPLMPASTARWSSIGSSRNSTDL